ncbi:16S rRNA (cytidine(1402)-2'-O)-methyltransferase [Candidatus Protofrankia californiensis]|uniref:16S rRNA (cytidine(1402)-2'-O)-methyltransferase n=1 Tax=Candidatus Protofrankia californiensis TaxID=1839754 RepID=UPI0019D04824|nr:16S rRNA (cytidine(1402)-2'-O)-methyltransferase [Candidatus Protofrankia californiensis]
MLCGAPIGDVRDASPRLGEVLARADIVAAEDTRRLRRLTAALGVTISGRVVSCFDANESSRADFLLSRLRAGATVALITDAGMPAVSDPGFRVVAAAAMAGVAVTVVPGPSAVTAALAVSGLPTDRWVFEGFLPRRTGERRSRLAELAGERRTLVILEAPHRLPATLDDLTAAFGADRAAVVCRELTKTWEEIVRDDLGALAAWAHEREVRGEITLVVAGRPATSPHAAAEPGTPAAAARAVVLAAEVAAREAGGTPRKAAITAVAAEHGVPRRVVYDAVLAAKARGDGG